MFIPRLRILVWSLFLVVIAPALRADATADARQAIQEIYAKRDAAASKKDAPAILGAYAPDYVHVDEKGKKMSLAQMKAALPQIFLMAQSVKGQTVIQKFRLKGKAATVTVSNHTEVSWINPQTRKPSLTVADSVSEEVWTKSGKTWLTKRSKTISLKRTVDGKPAPQNGKPAP